MRNFLFRFGQKLLINEKIDNYLVNVVPGEVHFKQFLLC